MSDNKAPQNCVNGDYAAGSGNISVMDNKNL